MFTIAALYDPKEGKKTGSIKTTSDKWISYWPSDKSHFAVGNEYSAVCAVREWEGKQYFTINSPGKNGSIQLKSGAATPTPSPAHNVPKQAPVASHGVAKDEMISRLAIAKSCIEANQSQADADSWMAWVEKRTPATSMPEYTPAQEEQLANEEVFADVGGWQIDDQIPF